MKYKYKIIIYSYHDNVIEFYKSNSRNARKHLVNCGLNHALKCAVCDVNGLVSYAMYLHDGVILFGAKRKD